jgi:flagellar protein FlgJ
MSMPATAPSTPLDFQGFAALRQAARESREDAAQLAARQFEALVLQMMVKNMRQASPGDPLFSSSAGKVYRDLFDQQLAMRLSEAKTVGLSDMLIEQLRASGALGKDGKGQRPVELTPPPRGLLPTLSGSRVNESSTAEPPDAAPAQTPEPISPFSGHDDFVGAVKPYAVRAGRALGVDPGILIAQAALETGWGRSVMRRGDGNSAFNLFGIKADPRWGGSYVTVPTLEYEGGVAVRRQAAFRSYESFGESFDDYVALVTQSPRYARALEQAADPRAYIREIQAAGYATDPRYAEKVIRIWEGELGGGLTVAKR